MNKKFVAVASFAFAFAFALTASAVGASEIYSASSGYLKTGSGMGAMAYQAPNVVAAQTALNACVPGTALILDGKMGALTTAKFKSFQASKGLVQDGIIGPLTAAQLAACSGSTPSPSTPSSLNGTDGTISDVNELSQYSAEEVGEGEDDVKVAGFEVEASNEGDVQIMSARISFTITNASGSDNLDDYVSKVMVMQGSEEVGSADAEDFDEGSSGVWTKTITLSDSVVEADETEKFYISVDGASTLDSGDIDSEVIAVDVENLRFKDGSGVVTTETGYDLDGMDVSVAFVSFSAAADTELKVSKASDSPDSGTVIIDDTENTDDVSLLKGKLEAEGTSDILLDELPITLTVTGAADVDIVTGSLTLIIDGETYTESVSTSTVTTATVTFDNLDLTIAAGETIKFEVLADINDIEAGTFDEGDTLTASLTATNNDYIDAENEEGDQLTDDTEKSGTATGDAQEFRTEGISVSLVSTDADVDADGTNTYNDTGTFVIKYKVTAVGETVYIADGVAPTIVSSVADATLGADANLYRLDIGGTATVSAVSDLITYTTTDGAEDSSNGFELEEGESAVVTLTVARTNTSVYASGGLMRVFLQSIGWNTDDSSTFNVYDFDLEDYKTDPISVN